MQLGKLQTDSEYSDAKLIIYDDDNNKPVSLNVHKIVLAACSEYFHKLFNNNEQTYEITVPDNRIVHDIIMTFYGKQTNIAQYHEWFHVLKMIQCQKFLQLPYNLSDLNSLEIPSHGFDLLLETIRETIGFDDITWDVVQIINKNLPDGYQMFDLPIELIRRMIWGCSIDCIVGADNNSIKLWDALSGEMIRTIGQHKRSILRICCSNDQTLIVTAGLDWYIRIWDVILNKEIKEIYIGEYVNDMCISSDKKVIAYGNNHVVRLYDVQTGQKIKTYKKSCTHLCISPDSKYVYCAHYNKIKILNIDQTSQKITKTVGKLYKKYCKKIDNSVLKSNLNNEITDITSMCCSSNNKYIVTTNYKDNTIKIWDVEKRTLDSLYCWDSNYLECVTASPNNKYIAVGGADYKIKIKNMETVEVIKPFRGHVSQVKYLCYSPDSTLITSIDARHRIKVWDASTGQHLRTLSGYYSDAPIKMIRIHDIETFNKIKACLTQNQITQLSDVVN